MISFVWPSSMPFTPWAGGVEIYTVSHLEELRNRQIDARIIACNQAVAASLKKYPDIPLGILQDEAELSKLDDVLLFVMHPMNVAPKQQAYVILHTPIKGPLKDRTQAFANNSMDALWPITTSEYMARYWKQLLDLQSLPSVVYPAVDESFAYTARKASNTARVLFAGRSTPEKGIYTLLASLHMPILRDKQFDLTCIETMNNSGGAEMVHAILRAHPRIKTTPAKLNRDDMAKVYASHDVVVMPSSSVLWKEAFGMVSIEAQASGCRVVASNDGGLPETDCGGLILVRPDDPLALANGIAAAIDMGPLTRQQRLRAAKKFSAVRSVDALIDAINYPIRSRILTPVID